MSNNGFEIFVVLFNIKMLYNIIKELFLTN